MIWSNTASEISRRFS